MTKDKKQLRAEAVERLGEVKSATDENLLDAVLGCHDGVTLHGAEKLFALKALLIDDEPPEGDALDLMRKAEGEPHAVDYMRLTLDASDTSDMFGKLADMVERDYVQRMDYEDAVELCGKYADSIHELTAERDNALEIRDKALGDAATFRYERDELQSRLIALTALPDKQVIESLEKQRDELKRELEAADRREMERDGECDECKARQDELIAELKAETIEYDKALDAVKGERDGWKSKVSNLADQAKHFQTKCAELEVRCDEWQHAEENYQDALQDIRAERDEWKTKCDTREVAYKQADAERERYSGQIDELIAERDEWKAKAELYERERDEFAEGQDYWHDKYDELAEGKSKGRAGQSNLEWLYNDNDAVRTVVNAFAAEDHISAYDGELGNWLLSDHVDANDDSAPETDVTAEGEGANDGNATCNKTGVDVTHDSREKLEADVREHSMESDSHSMTSESESESGSDSREKLEADAYKLMCDTWNKGLVFSKHPYEDMALDKVAWEFGDMLELLDRQASITERHWMEICGANANANVELKRKIDELEEALAARKSLNDYQLANLEEWHRKYDELTADLETARAKNRSLRAHITRMQDGRHGWHVKAKELQARVDELEAMLESDEDALYNGGGAKDWYDAMREQLALVEGLERRNVALVDQMKQAKDEILQYAEDCGECTTAMPENVTWPRYDDGSLVRFGDEVTVAGGLKFAVERVEFTGSHFKFLTEKEGVFLYSPMGCAVERSTMPYLRIKPKKTDGEESR